MTAARLRGILAAGALIITAGVRTAVISLRQSKAETALECLLTANTTAAIIATAVIAAIYIAAIIVITTTVADIITASATVTGMTTTIVIGIIIATIAI